MIRLKIWSYFLDECNKKIYSISGDISSLRPLHINSKHIRFSHRLLESSKILTAYNVSSTKQKIVSVHSNKIGVLGVTSVRTTHGLFNPIAAFSHKNSINLMNVRHFSDVSLSTSMIKSTVQVEGIWKTLSESAPVETSQNALIWFHSTTGLPWWLTIILATWTIRATVTLPLALYQSYILAKVLNLKLEMNDIVEDLKLETKYDMHKFKWTENYARAMYNRSVKKQWQELIERENCHPMKSFILILIQLPMWVVISASLRNCCSMLPYPTERAQAIYLELTTGGFGWFTDLTQVDPYYIIPISLGLLNLTIIELQSLMAQTEPNKIQKFTTNLFRLISVGMIPLASCVPAGLSLYWASSSAFGVIQNLILISPKVRRFARIPPTENEIDEPYRYLHESINRKLGVTEVGLPKSVKKT